MILDSDQWSSGVTNKDNLQLWAEVRFKELLQISIWALKALISIQSIHTDAKEALKDKAKKHKKKHC